MRASLLVVLLVLGGLGLFLLAGPERGVDRPGPRPELGSTSETTADRELQPSVEGVPSGDGQRTVAELPPAEPAPRGEADRLPTVDLRVLEADTDQALAGFRLRVTTYGVADLDVEAVTDADGRCEIALPFARGKLYVEHVVDAGHPRFSEPWVFEEESWLVDAHGVERFAHTLNARPPLARIGARVVRANGAPAVGAEVQLSGGVRGDGGWVSWKRIRFEVADERGEVLFRIHRPAEHGYLYVLELREAYRVDGIGEVTDGLTIGPPLDEGPHELRLYPAGELAFETVDESGAPVAGVEVTLRSEKRERHRGPLPAVSDESGRGRVVDLPAGSYDVVARDPEIRAVLGETSIELHPGEQAALRLVVAPVATAVLVSGRVVDAAGAPVPKKWLAVSVDGARPAWIHSGDDGAFELVGPTRAERVTVYGVAGVFDPPVEPDVVTVPAGTADLLLTVGEEPAELLAFLEVVDARTGDPVPEEADVAIRVYREPTPGARVTSSMAYGIADGTCEVEFVAWGEVRWHVTARGYREQRGVFDLAAFEAGPPLIRVELEPGFRREIFVRDERTGAPLAGVAVLDDAGRRVATTAYDGSTVLEGDAWPEWLTFELGGYEPLRWRVLSHWIFHSRTFWMQPRE